MIKLQHNITLDRFEDISWEPDWCISLNTFYNCREPEIIERTIAIPDDSETDRVIIRGIRRFNENNIEYIQKYVFTIVDDENKSGKFDDGYAYIAVQGGRLLKPKIYAPRLANQGIDKIKKFGYNVAKDKYEIWKECAEDESDEIPLDENGLFDQEVFCNELNNTLWEFGFDEMKKNPSLAKAFESCGIDKAGYAFFDGVNQFIEECFNKP
jgi:hypothetical protein